MFDIITPRYLPAGNYNAQPHNYRCYKRMLKRSACKTNGFNVNYILYGFRLELY